jgi:hypothetical protein
MEGYEGAPSAFKEEVRLESDTSASKRLASFLDTDPMSTSGSAIPLRRKLSSIFVVGMHDVESVPRSLMIPLRTLPPPSSASSILPGLRECLGLRLSALFVALRLRLLEVTGRGCSALHHAHSRPCSRSRLCVYLASALAFVLLVALDHRSSFLFTLAPSVGLASPLSLALALGSSLPSSSSFVTTPLYPRIISERQCIVAKHVD